VKPIISLLKYAVDTCVKIIPRGLFLSALKTLIRSRSRTLKPADSLRFLFTIEHFLYTLEGGKSVEYGGGVHTKHRHIRYHEFFIDRIGENETVLDIGCGIGAVAASVADATSAHVTAIDMNGESIDTARRIHNRPNVEYIHGDATKYLPEGRFDTVILSNVLEHLSGRTAFLETIRTRIAPKRMLVRVPLFERDWRVPLKKELGLDWRLDSTHETEYTLESFTGEMTSAGFVITHQEVRWGEIWAEAVPQHSATPGA